MKRLLTGAKYSAGAAALEVPLLRPALPSYAAAPRAIDLADIGARMLIVALFTFMAVNIGADFVRTGRLTGLLLLANEAVVVVLTVFRRSTAIVDRSLRARILTIVSVMGPPLVRPAGVAPLAPEVLTVAISGCGLAFVLAAKLCLGRSFGLMPANRGVVSTGLYRFVRHPIYMGYLVTHLAFLASSPTIWNVMTLVGADVALLIRAVCEEQTLSRDPAYRAYLQRVRWRVCPGVF